MKPSKESVLKAVKSYPELKDYMKEQFPEYFEEYLQMDKGMILSGEAQNFKIDGLPFFLGMAWTREGDYKKALLVRDQFEVEVIPNYWNGLMGLKFKIK